MYLNVELIHALEPSERRCFNRREAASYVGVSVGTFDKLMRQAVLPAPVELLGRKVWDRHALDIALDRISGVSRRHIDQTPPLTPEGRLADELDAELEAFKARHGHA